MEGPTWITYVFFRVISSIHVWSSERWDEILVSHGHIWIFPYQITLSQDEVEVQTLLDILWWWSCAVTDGQGPCQKWLFTFPSSNNATTEEWHGRTCTDICSTVTSSWRCSWLLHKLGCESIGLSHAFCNSTSIFILKWSFGFHCLVFFNSILVDGAGPSSM